MGKSGLIEKYRKYKLGIEIDDRWNIAIRKKEDEEELFWCLKETKFNEMDLKKDEWYADPFLFTYENKTFLFFELYDMKQRKGKIAYCEIIEGEFGEITVILDKPYHLSFPYIFEWNGSVYLMPESSEANKIIIFKSDNFPLDWSEHKILIDSIKVCDSIILTSTTGYWLLTSTIINGGFRVTKEAYKVNLDRMEIIGSPIFYGEGSYGYRNAGKIITRRHNQFRVAQDCTNNKYGKGLVVYNTEIDDFGSLKEHEIKHIDGRSLNVNNNYFDGVHTYNSNEKYEVIDLKTTHKNNFFEKIKTVYRILKKHIQKRVGSRI